MQRIVAEITVSHVEKQTERHVCPNRAEMRNKMSDAIKYLWANQAQGTLEQVYVNHHEVDGISRVESRRQSSMMRVTLAAYSAAMDCNLMTSQNCHRNLAKPE